MLDSTELEVKTATQLIWGSHVSDSTGKEGSFYAGWVINPVYQGEIELLLQNEGKIIVWTTGDSLEWLLVLSCPIIKVSTKLHQPNLGKTTNVTDPSKMKFGVTLSGKKPWPAEVPAEGKGNTEWVVE